MSESKTFEQILEEDEVLVYTCKGFSMYPLLRQNKDILIIRKPAGKLKKHDIVLFKDKGKYVLHRILKISGDRIITAGDHNTFKDQPVDRSQIIGILTTIVRDGKEIRTDDLHMRAFGFLVGDLFDLKAVYLKSRSRLHRFLK